MNKPDRLDQKQGNVVSRRDMLGKVGVVACISAAGVSLVSLARAIMPEAMPDPSQQFKIGPPQDYPTGTVKNVEEENVVIFADEDGIFAISTVCTHLGCIVSLDESGEFECPCNGSRFLADGKVSVGPAPTPLAWLEVSRLPSGQLAVDKSKKVPTGTKVAV